MKGRGAAIGTFDGVHLGHRCVLDVLKNECGKRDLEPVVLTFDRHPLSLIDPSRAPKEVTSLPVKKRLLSEIGTEPIVFEFNEEMRSKTAGEWLEKIHDELGVKLLVIGYDNTFGSDGVDLSLADYISLGKKTGIEVIDAPVLENISSSAVRKAIRGGDVEEAARMLGRPYSLTGVVTGGRQIGRTMGFPTANLMFPDNAALPANGTYAAVAELSDGREFKALVNIGTRPTFRGGNDTVTEAHLMGFQGDLYDRPLTLKFVKRLRDEKKFDSVDELRRQILADKEIVAGMSF